MNNSTTTYAANTSIGNNSVYVSPLSGPGFVVFNVVMLLAVVLPVIAANTVILVALVLELSTAKVVRLVLGSILVSCLLDALGLAMYHISGIILNLSPVDNPPEVPCTITLFLIGFGGAARMAFTTTFVAVVYIVKSGKDTKKHTFTVLLVVVVALWVLAFLGASPMFSQKVVPTNYADSLSCGIGPVGIISYIFGGLYGLVFALAPLTVTIVFLVITACFIRYHYLTATQAQAAMVKFGFFLVLGNDINLAVQAAPAMITGLAILDTERKAFDKLIYTSFTLLNLALIPTPILIPIYFKPIRKRLWHWLCCCMLKKRMAKLMNNRNMVEGRQSVHGPERAMKEV